MGAPPAGRGGRGHETAQDIVQDLRRRGCDVEQIREDLKSRGFKPARISQLLSWLKGKEGAGAPGLPAPELAHLPKAEVRPAGAPAGSSSEAVAPRPVLAEAFVYTRGPSSVIGSV